MVDSKGARLLCTPSTVGMLRERGRSLRYISQQVGEPIETVKAYLRKWRSASEEDRSLARQGTKI